MLLLLPVLGILGIASPASAHPTLLSTDPADGTAVVRSPGSIVLVFNEAVTAGPSAVVVMAANGHRVPVSLPSTADGGRVVTVRPVSTLRPGTYLVRWQVTGTDGDQVTDDFRFAVGTAVAGSAAGAPGGSVAVVVAALRFLLFAGLAVAVGEVVGRRLQPIVEDDARTVRLRSWMAPAVLLALAGVLGLATVLIADSGAWQVLWRSRPGQLLLAEGLGLAATLWVALGRRVDRSRWPLVPLAVVVGAEGLRSHANIAEPGWGALVTGVHLAAAAVWAGTLLYVVRATRSWPAEHRVVGQLLARYIRLAGWIFVGVVGSGALSAVLLVPLSAVLDSGYGRILVGKLTLVALAAALALTARLRLRRDGRRVQRVYRLTRVEGGALLGALLASAVLVSAPPPSSGLLAPLPPVGQVVPLGARAGQVGVAIAASAAQLVVRLSAPRLGNDYAPRQPSPSYRLSGHLATGGRPGAALRFRACGEGCFVAAADWRTGDNVLTLLVGAAGWRGGAVSMLIPWPAQPGAQDLARAVRATRTVPSMTIYETVTSDTATASPAPQRLNVSGAWFVGQEPYASGVAPIAARLAPPGRPVELALGYPAAAVDVRLTLDRLGRISAETLTDDTHLIQRRFVYPSGG